MIIIGVDFGEAKTGVAICDKNQILAYPVCTIREKDYDELAKKIADLSKSYGAKRVVLGYPKNMNGTVGNSAQSVHLLEKKLHKTDPKLEIILWDERLTTVFAQKNFAILGKKSLKYKHQIDEASACLILQNYLDYLKSNK